jgi:hypothetical protein
MSHFLVLVIGKDVEKQLAPYSEQDEKYFQFVDKEPDYYEEYTSGCAGLVELNVILPSGNAISSEGIKDVIAVGGRKFSWPGHVRDRAEFDKDITEVPYMDMFKTFEEYLAKVKYSKKETHYCPKLKKEIKGYGYVGNPKSKWDWYSIGGRWSGMLKLKPGAVGKRGSRSWTNEKDLIGSEYVDQAFLKNIDLESMKIEAVKAAKKNWKEAQTKDSMIRALSYGIQKGDTEETYVKRNSGGNPLMTFAVLKDGEWYERGEMGWWGIVHGEKEDSTWESEFNSLIENLDPETLITMVDCHI